MTNVWTNYSCPGTNSVFVDKRIWWRHSRTFPNAATGAHYGAWVYPEGSTGGSNVLKLIKFSTWTTFGYNGTNAIPMQVVSLPGVGAGVHTVKMAFFGSQIAVYYDGNVVISMTDTDTAAGPYLTGGVTAENWTDMVGYNLFYDNVNVSALVNNDSYVVNEDTPLMILAPGVLANDTDGFGTNLSATNLSGPANGSLTFNTNGSFTYIPNGGFLGQDSFVYQALDGTNNLGTATVYLNVTFEGAGTVFSENFDSVTAPALPSGWTTSSTGAESNWTTTTLTNDTAPNAAFCPDVPAIGQSQLISPTIVLPAGRLPPYL